MCQPPRGKLQLDLAGTDAKDLVDALFDPAVLPRALPAWDDILMDTDDYIWAAATPLPSSDMQAWDVFAPDG